MRKKLISFPELYHTVAQRTQSNLGKMKLINFRGEKLYYWPVSSYKNFVWYARICVQSVTFIDCTCEMVVAVKKTVEDSSSSGLWGFSRKCAWRFLSSTRKCVLIRTFHFIKKINHSDSSSEEEPVKKQVVSLKAKKATKKAPPPKKESSSEDSSSEEEAPPPKKSELFTYPV